MCHGFDLFHERVRIAEELRKKQPTPEPPNQRGTTELPVKPTEAEERGTREQPVPA